ncbi:oligosaccharyl transferase alpha subunit [Phanerochaete sordida]|uniref:Dolichyl-diphosphooligosaccharide--protein glycosyltransferase subunit 1 n=1 Tax=Phanerochaete sordida TaxID=48140 RepID=A0A9P3FX04_9APHY|nr:oligosaccharyl transferase alpha subunit [Phanerochaete sordida]
MAGLWRSRAALLLLSLLSPLVSAEHSFENTAIVRTVELGGSLVHVTTTYAVRALEDGSSIYTVALAEDEHKKTSWIQAKMKGETASLPLEHFGLNPNTGAYLYAVEFPKALKANASANLVLETVQTHATYPWPQVAAQKDQQYLKYEADLFVLSPYYTSVQRTKIRAPTPQINAYTTPEDMESFTQDAPVTKSGATVTYGPYSNIPSSANRDFVEGVQKRISVQYNYPGPKLEVTKLERAAEISHWGANLNIQDNIWLHNAGPALKGHFSRLEFQSQNYYNKISPSTLVSIALHLPAGVHDVYYYDLNGNVSTSRLRTTPSVPKGSNSNQYTLFEMRPRYPVLGGWNYSFTLGWDSPLADYAGYDKESGSYLVGVPLQTLVPGAVVDEAEIKIILPEGATDIKFYPPFPAVMNSVSEHITYLDTKGRPAITLQYQQLTDKHTGVIFVSYKVPFSAHLTKPLAVATALMGLFALAFAWKRVDTRIQK